jgi:hypothetical protein
MNTNNEPVALQALLVTAINATVGILAFAFEWSQQLTALLLAASGAWIAVAAYVARSKVAPTAVVDTVMLRRGSPSITPQEYEAAREA